MYAQLCAILKLSFEKSRTISTHKKRRTATRTLYSSGSHLIDRSHSTDELETEAVLVNSLFATCLQLTVYSEADSLHLVNLHGKQ